MEFRWNIKWTRPSSLLTSSNGRIASILTDLSKDAEVGWTEDAFPVSRSKSRVMRAVAGERPNTVPLGYSYNKVSSGYLSQTHISKPKGV